MARFGTNPFCGWDLDSQPRKLKIGLSGEITERKWFVFVLRKLTSSSSPCRLADVAGVTAIMSRWFSLRWTVEASLCLRSPVEVVSSKRRTGPHQFATLPHSHNAGSSPSLCRPALCFYHDHTTTSCNFATKIVTS